MARRTMEQQHRGLADEARWVKWLLEGLAWLTAISGTIVVAFNIYEGATASVYENGDMYFLVALWAFASSLVSFLIWKLLAIAVGSVSLNHRRFAAQQTATQPHEELGAAVTAREEALVG